MIRSHKDLLTVIAQHQVHERQSVDKTKLDDLFVLERWIERCAQDIQLPYPSIFQPAEKPDFVIAGQVNVGIEVTKFLSEQRKRASILADTQGVGHCPTQFDFDSPKRRNPDIEDMIRKNPPGFSGWREIRSKVNLYVSMISSTVDSKAEKVIKHGLHKCERFILVMEDHHMNSNLSRAELNRLLGPKMEQHFAECHSFDEVWFTSLISSDGPLRWRKNSQP